MPRCGMLEIDETAYQYRGLEEAMAKVGACQLDVTCYPAWADTAKAVGGIGTIGATGTLWCTGTLLNDEVTTTEEPYFLTANHCISTVSKADSIEVYWLYASTSCNGTVPSPSSVPRTTGGADYLAGSPAQSGTDVTFLRLRETVPSGLTMAGYTTAAAAVGTAVTGIHHPSGSYKRISFGDISDNGSPGQGGVRLEPIERFHEVLWNDGVTEPGSSGSALFDSSSQLVVGQLYGGYAACTATDEPDYYGRFDVSYPLLASWLAGTGGSEFTLTINVQGDGYVRLEETGLVVTSDSFQIGSGIQLELEAVATGEEPFSGWQVEGVDELQTFNPALVTMTQDMSITAVFGSKASLGCGVDTSSPGWGRVAEFGIMLLLFGWISWRCRRQAPARK